MGGTIFCNKVKDRVESIKCKSCQYGEIPRGWQMARCTYNQRMIEKRTGKAYAEPAAPTRSKEDELVVLKRQAAWIEERMNRAYRQGRTRLGDSLAWELGQVQKKIKKLKEETK